MGSLIFEEYNINPDDRINPSFDLNALRNVKFQTQNVNSLNLSTLDHNIPNVDKFGSKINHILKQSSDVILLQDVRIGTKASSLKKVIQFSKYGSFDVFINSSKSKRGCAILIKKSLNFKVFKSYHSLCENVLLLDLHINEFRLSLVCTYGPIEKDNMNFYISLKEKIKSINNVCFILGGDLNAIPTLTDTSLCPNSGNLDTISMSSLPNVNHCRNLVDWINEGFAIDLFRFIHPNKLEFSYIPYDKTKKNRSRIDHFLVSPSLINVFNKCYYIDSKISNFDHKAVVIESKKLNVCKPKKIDPTLLDIPFLYESIKFEVYFCILQYFEIENKAFLNECLQTITRLSIERNLLQHCNYKSDLLVQTWINTRDEKITTLCNNFPSIDECYEFPSNIESDLFLDILLNCIKNSTISLQSNYIKSLTSEKSEISLQLSKLKMNTNIWSKSNIDSIQSLELRLTKLEDIENVRALDNFKYFNIVNSEKGSSKYYSKLLKNSNSSDILDKLKDSNGQNFANTRARDDYLVKHFKDKFEKPFQTTISLREFFGDDWDHPILNNHKLSDIDRASLENEITIDELQKSLDTSNFNSCSGVDGFHIKAIRKFWDFLKIPFLKGFNNMVRKKELSPLLRCSSIRLIPKNGPVDQSKLSNARPIANLPAPTKLFTGVIALRLNSVIDKVVYRAQKGYSTQYCIQEGLISMYEMISKSLKTNTPLGILNLDFKAAFDTLSHDYLIDVLDTFNFGPNFINLVKTCLNSRYGHIITNTGITSNFMIALGCLQGDRPSCPYFKVGLNPLVIKIIINLHISIPPQIPFNVPPDFTPDPASFFADDGDIFFKPNIQSLNACNTLLTQFGNMSGLMINSSKTKICLVGPNINDNIFLNYANYLGFEIVNEFKMLGLTFDNKLESMEQNWDKCLRKMSKIKNFWSILGLSVPGKITIIKTFLLPQITYLGTVLTPPENVINDIEKLITGFINQNSRVAKNKIFSSADNGGLGIPNVRDFLKSMDILLFKKSLKINDTWTNELHRSSICTNDRFYFNNNIDFSTNPILHRIIASYKEFSQLYWIDNSNIHDLRIFDNPAFHDTQLNKLSRATFTQDTWNNNENLIKSLKFKDVLSNENRVLSYESFKVKTNIQINLIEYFHINSIFRNCLSIYKDKLINPNKRIEDFFKKPKLKSKNFRDFFSKKRNLDYKTISTSRNRYMWCNIFDVDVQREFRWHKTWQKCFLPMEHRNFGFKVFNNYLKFNSSISHFSEEVSAACTFCTNTKALPAPKETISHFFLFCPTTVDFVSDYFNKFLENTNIQFEQKFLLLGAPNFITESLATVLNIEILIISLFLFKARLQNKIPLKKNFLVHIKSTRELLLRNSSYKRLYSRLLYDPG